MGDQLCLMYGLQSLDCFDFYDELVLHNEVKAVAASQSHTLVLDRQGFLALKAYASQVELMREKLLVRGFEQPGPTTR